MFGQNLLSKLKTISILFIDDDKTVTNMFYHLFGSGLGVNVYRAFNGEEGFEIFLEKKIDLVITDIKMPHLNGYDMAKKMFKKNSDIKIMFISACKDNFFNEELQLFIDNIVYVPKPVSYVKLRDGLSLLLGITKEEES